MLLDILAILTEITVSLEAPVKGSIESVRCKSGHGWDGVAKHLPNDPILKTLNISGDHVVNLRTPRRDLGLIVTERIDSLLAKVSDVVDCALQGVPVVRHQDDDHVVGIALRLFDVVGEDVLFGTRISVELWVAGGATYVGPCNKVVSALIESSDDRVLRYKVRQIDIESIPGRQSDKKPLGENDERTHSIRAQHGLQPDENT